ncbi:MAG: SURF1 family protein [Nocardioides sp.]|uniref:SURF1 family protein n=1 Tax=Nocardioides sp. TaxID=35761 RepID=UPI0039E52365
MSEQDQRAPGVLSPRLWGAHALMLVAVAAAVALGLWQYGVSKQHKVDQIAQLAHANPTPLTDVMGGNDAFPGDQVGRPVVVTGTWVTGDTVYVSGHRHAGRSGYWVATPVHVDGSGTPGSAIYVVRGWVEDPSQAPAEPTGHTRLVGWLQAGDQDTSSASTKRADVVSAMDLATLIDHVDGDLFSAYLVDADRQADWPDSASPINDGTTGLVAVPAPDPPQADASTGLRNFLYALEWWAFGLLAGYIWWRYVRDAVRPRSVAEPETDVKERAVASGP